jgi:F0F1-type ATP synthase assembly protein I
MNLQQGPTESWNFSQVFEEMCNFIAVAKTGNPEQTLAGLIQLCLLDAADEPLLDADSFRKKINSRFGIVVTNADIQNVIQELEKNGAITRPGNSNYILTPESRKQIDEQVQKALQLEEAVRNNWFDQLDKSCPTIDKDAAWNALRAYLSRTFRRHGIQAAALLDPSIRTPAGYERSLSAILEESVEDYFDKSDSATASEVISSFLAEISSNPSRMTYITQLADGAFNFFTLQVPLSLSVQLQKGLNELTLFLDTNFLFGIMDLHHNSQVEVSLQLMNAIQSFDLPFKLRYHEATARELRNTITYYGNILRSRRWNQSLSRAAAASHNLSGIEQKFHERNAVKPIDVDEFLRPYEHFDVLLNQKKISVYRTNADRTQAQTDLYHDYKDFLEKNGRTDKPYETVMHDAVVLDATRQLRSRARSSLEAGALFLSCDYFLYRFEWETARTQDRPACVLLPNIFWQILRPFVPTNPDFDRAFAQTFALPEFRAIGGAGSKACSKMVQILATYEDVPEETAFRLLSNGVLLDQLKTATTDKQFEEYVEAALVLENKNLLEEKAILESALARERQQRDEERQQRILKEKQYEQRLRKLEDSVRARQEELESLQRLVLEKERLARGDQEQSITKETGTASIRQELTQTEKKAFRLSLIAGFSVGTLLVFLFEFFIRSIPWLWILEHKNSLPLQIGFILILLFGSFGTFVPNWRKWCWGTGVFGILVVIISLL